MNVRISLLVAASLVLAGCPEKPPEKKAPAPAPKVAAAPPPAAPPPAAAPATSPPPAAEPGKAAAAKKSGPRCPPACEVTIPVTDECKIGSPAPDPLHVSRGTHVIRFKLDGPQKYSFDGTKGVAFKKAGAPFSPGGGGTPKVVVLTDKNLGAAALGEWKYEINVVDTSKKTCKLDPSIINDEVEP